MINDGYFVGLKLFNTKNQEETFNYLWKKNYGD